MPTTFSTGAGVRYNFNKTDHLLVYAGPGLAHPSQSDPYSWYASMLFTF